MNIIKRKYFVGMLIILGMFAACDLDKTPLSALSPETFFSTENELKLYSNKFYQDILPEASAIYNENADDIVITPLNTAVSGQRTIPATGGGWSWNALRRINYLLENSHQTPDIRIRNEYNALAKFFRAYFYFEKLKRFGEVPWFNKVLGSQDAELFKPRDSRKLITDSILQDLNYAIEHLPTTKNVYRVNKWTALALKSRVGLFEGTFRKYHNLGDYEKYLTACVEASQILISTGGYSLYKTGNQPYRDLFANSKAIAQEIILARDYADGLNLVHNVQNYQNSSTMGRPGLSKSVANYYLTSSGERFTDLPNYNTKEFAEETINRDPRMSQTIRTPGYTRIGGTTTVAPNLTFTVTGYHFTKYSMEEVYDANGKSFSDMPIFRIAEAYLNLAEAKAELGSLSQNDLDNSINLLRSRVSMPALSLTAANAQPDDYLSSGEYGFPNVTGYNKGIILEIRRERTIELIMEGFRYYDIMRWKAGKLFEKPFLGIYFNQLGSFDLDNNGTIDVCLYQGTKPNSTANVFLEVGKDITLTEGNKGYIEVHGNINRVFREDRDYLYPIPTEEINLSNNILTQNPNW